MKNYIRYNVDTKSYSFEHLTNEKYSELSSDEKIEYLEQQMMWTLNEDWDHLNNLMNEARASALRDKE